ncbi:hypothetical protein OCL06_08475 [Alteromonas sp. ASW11-19]|uniref:Anti-sigma factor n=1 Tax=Alteromonas salexigens TaxID=2982530 RepID=A0ABT2VP11_9ALTE|nr:hypothetical protein [Alteromonas salexigens]MCU7554633.1 hypothetical protein [Alteromonas salexigens]
MSKFEQQLNQQLHDLAKEKAPQRDLWRGIELGIEHQHDTGTVPQNRHRRLAAVAASVALVVSLSWYGIQQTSVPATDHPTGQALVKALSNQHEQQKQALLVQYTDAPAMTENWEAQLAELDEAASAIKAALKEDPNNGALLRMLQQVHQQQITLIERVHAPQWQQI